MFTGKVDHSSSLNRPGKGREMLPLVGGDFRGALDAAKANVGAAVEAGQSDAKLPETPVKALLPMDSSSKPRELRPLSEWDNIPGVKGIPQTLKPLNTTRHPAMPVVPLEAKDFIPGVRQSKAGSKEDEVESKARKWVAQTFYGTLFKQMRESPFKSKLFDGGRGGQAFAPMLDQHLVDRMARGSDKRLTNAIARRLMGKRGGAAGAVRTSKTGAINASGSGSSSEAPLSPSSLPAGPAAPGGFEGLRIHVPPGLRA